MFLEKNKYGGNMAKKDYESKTEELVMPILEREKFILWDVEYVKEGADYYLRVFIDKEGGITIDDCVIVSRELSDELDRLDFIEDAYVLEVSSPGLGRTLKKDKEFERSIGQSVDVKLYKPLDGTKEYSGILKEISKDKLVIVTDEIEKSFIRSDIAKVNLTIDF